ncbi:MAG: hypothetical protein FWD41_00475 [Actinomycetia bacterium]|nr:hypothetical protein [Actinomycetes bacterium]
MKGIIDIGSNSMRLSMYDTEHDDISLLFSRKALTALAAEIDEYGNLTQRGIDKAIYTLLQFRHILDNVGDPAVSVIATASLRNVANTAEAIAAIEQGSGFSLILLSGTEEAHYGSKAVRWGMENGQIGAVDRFMVVDIGGGSTELSVCDGPINTDETSIPVGSLNQYLANVDYLLPTRQNRHTIEELVAGHLDNHWKKGPPHREVIVGVGGSNRAALRLANAHFEHDLANTVIKTKQLKELIHTFDPDQKKSIVRLARAVPDRLHTLLPGMIILRTITKVVGAKTFVTSDWGVREGYLIHLIEQGGIDG